VENASEQTKSRAPESPNKISVQPFSDEPVMMKNVHFVKKPLANRETPEDITEKQKATPLMSNLWLR